MAYKRILTIQDISCAGQCSMTVALPILSACGHEVCILPAAVLSTHTGGFGRPAVRKLGDLMWETVRHWKENDITFDLIYTGYLGSLEAVKCAREILGTMLAPGGVTIVDPAMADHGKLYSGLDGAYAEAMKGLCGMADVILPNITEAAMMTGLPYREELDEDYVRRLMEGLQAPNAVLTGVGFRAGETGYGVRTEAGIRFGHHEKIGRSFHGTGDIFASAFTGALACGKPLADAADVAAKYTFRCILDTDAAPAHWYGVKFEPALGYLMELIK